jgi:hydroxyacylglutathione hydrolase
MSDNTRVHIETRSSGIWQTNSVVVSAAGEALVVDPAFFPRELEELSALVRRLTGDGAGATTVAFTHGHWDHVAGWRHFPGARVVASAELARAVTRGEPAAAENLAQLNEYEGRWYVPRASPAAWPPSIIGLADGDRFHVGPVSIEALVLPGHSADGLGLIVHGGGLLLPGDHLSPCEIPFVEDLGAYRFTLLRLRGLLGSVERVIPGHGPELDRAAAEAVLEADLHYLNQLAEHAARDDVAGALSMPLPRAEAVPDMADRHRENCQAAGLVIAD